MHLKLSHCINKCLNHYPHMPIGKVWIYRLLFVSCLCVCFCLLVCTVTDFSAEDKASGVKFCTAIHRRPVQGISHFRELCSLGSPNSDESTALRQHDNLVAQACTRVTRIIGMSPKTDVLVCIFCVCLYGYGFLRRE